MKKFISLIVLLMLSAWGGCKYQGMLDRKTLAGARYKAQYKPPRQQITHNKFIEITHNKFKYDEIGIASWYGHREHRKNLTANGDLYDKNLLTAASLALPLPSIIQITNLKNNKSVKLLVNDRGPYVAKYGKNRIIDVSERAAKILGFKSEGITTVRVKYLDDDTKKLLKFLKLKKQTKHVAYKNFITMD